MSDSVPPQVPQVPQPPYAGAPAAPPGSQAASGTLNAKQARWVLIGIGAAVVLGLTFYGGVQYGESQMRNQVVDAFSDFESDMEDSFNESFGEDEGDEPAEQVELRKGSPVVVTTDEAEFTITLLSTELENEAAADDVLTRHLAYTLKIENTGDVAGSPSSSSHYETDEGQVLDFAGVFCSENDLPEDEIDPGQFVEGCKSSDLPDESGKLFIEGFDQELFIVVPGRS